MNKQGIRIENIYIRKTASKIEEAFQHLKRFCTNHYTSMKHRIKQSALCFKIRKLLKKFNAQNIELDRSGNSIQFHYTLADRVVLVYDELAQIQRLITRSKEKYPELANVRVVKMFDTCTMYIKIPAII